MKIKFEGRFILTTPVAPPALLVYAKVRGIRFPVYAKVRGIRFPMGGGRAGGALYQKIYILMYIDIKTKQINIF